MLAALQENLLCLLCFSTKEAQIIRGVVDLNLFGGIYRVLAARVYDHIDRFKSPPADHLPDIMGDKLESEKRQERELYTDLIENIHNSRKGINAEYVMAQLGTFIKRQSLRSVAIELAKELQRDTEDSLEKAEALIASANTQSLTVFDPGTRLNDPAKALKFLDIEDTCFPTNIPELDKRNFGPTRKELWLFIGNTKAGKSWGLIHLAKVAMMHRIKVCHISLEMSEARCAQRYFQALFALSKRKDKFLTTRLEVTDGQITGLDDRYVKPKLALDDPKIRQKLRGKIDKWGARLLDNIFIKQFPTSHLTMGQLEAYLDNLENTQHFVPDLLILDYPDLMKLGENKRESLDQVYKELRGLFVKRNIAGAVVSQSHRAAAKVRTVGADNVADAYDKIMHADTIITYSQTPTERKLGLARLHVAGGRNDEDKITIVISQQYGLGKFVIDSALQRGNYFGILPQEGFDEQEET
jgi:replicative DNA helicase